jgi:hypothetical protein
VYGLNRVYLETMMSNLEETTPSTECLPCPEVEGAAMMELAREHWGLCLTHRQRRMSDIYFDRLCPDRVRRAAPDNGDFFIYSPCNASSRLCALAQRMITEAFERHRRPCQASC